jgi:hypothetical protein
VKLFGVFFVRTFLLSFFIFIFTSDRSIGGTARSFQAKISFTKLSTGDSIHYESADGKDNHCSPEEKSKRIKKCKVKDGQSFSTEGKIFIRLNSEKSKLIIQCQNGHEEPPLRGVQNRKYSIGDFCPGKPNPEVGSDLQQFRNGGTNREIPYIIGPRYSMIRDKQPVFRWNSVPGAMKYSVFLFHDRSQEIAVCTIHDVQEGQRDGVITVNSNRCKNDLLQPYQLQDNYFYKLKVIAYFPQSEISSDREDISQDEYRAEYRGVGGIEFRLINYQEEQEISRLIEELKKDAESEEEKVVRIASIYGVYNLKRF